MREERNMLKSELEEAKSQVEKYEKMTDLYRTKVQKIEEK